MNIEFGRDTCCYLEPAESREWLITNGIGGYGSGTIAGTLTRRYHGLLVAALKPPLGRTLLATKLDETAHYGGVAYPLFANRWADGTVDPHGYRHIESFGLEGTTPTWRYACGGAIVDKRVWMKRGANTTYVRYEVSRAGAPLTLEIKTFVNYRDYHGTTSGGDWRMRVEPAKDGVSVAAYDGAARFFVLADKGDFSPAHEWYRGFSLSIEKQRGLGHIEDHLLAGTLRATLKSGESLTIAISAEDTPSLDGAKEFRERRRYEDGLVNKIQSPQMPGWVSRLALAADQFIADRPTPDEPGGKTVIAGYHWFGDWGRDTMISLPGLTISTARHETARSILSTFAKYVSEGMLPNRFPDAGEAPEYNTVDATLWYFEAARAYHAATGDDDFLKEIFPALAEIIDRHTAGTRYNIRVDSKDGLLYAGQNGVQLTWMDAKVGDWVVTPRIGKPVEVNALWYNALLTMAKFAKRLAKPHRDYEAAAKRAHGGFERFWNERDGYCFDVIDSPSGDDSTLRPNQIFAVSLPESPLTAPRQKRVVDICREKLLTSHGLRSLSPDHPEYIGRYGGDQLQRDGAYHQGAVWGWLLGAFTLAHLRVYESPERARDFLIPMSRHILAHGVGTMSEIFEGDAPMSPRGCIAQAWTVAEVLRAWMEVSK
ncbi:MAG: amylo-alpha-1,6-glucosidase [Deltaproteobacteria bacterium]